MEHVQQVQDVSMAVLVGILVIASSSLSPSADLTLQSADTATTPCSRASLKCSSKKKEEKKGINTR